MGCKPNYSFRDTKDIIRALLFLGKAQEELFCHARQVRNDFSFGLVEIRSVIEYSNICQQACNYCGMNRYSGLKRYVMGDSEFLDSFKRLYNIGRKVILIQTGENQEAVFFDNLHGLLKVVRNKYPDLTLMCSFGNLPEDKYKRLAAIGIDRYLLKFETSSPLLYKKIKPSDTLSNRLAHIKTLKKTGFYVSSGNITGLPGQTLESLASDILLLKKLDLSMGSTSVFIPNNLSNYADYHSGNINLALNFMAILRIICPSMLIPTTSSLELVAKDGQYLGLMAGANTVTLHDGTPKDAEDKYVIYKRKRYRPKDILFKVVDRAGLIPSPASLVREGKK
jgi:biotin synthase